MAEFLFEIGFEEMPASWLHKLADELGANFEKLATGEQLRPKHVDWAWTSRRLVLSARVEARQEDRSVVEWGPAAKIARDASGQWSKAAEGFARKQMVSLDALTLAPKAQGSTDLYLSATKDIPGRPTPDVLADILPPLLRSLTFPKRMNWDAWLDDGRGAFEFGRPIQWIVALLDGEIVPLTIFEAVAGARGKARFTSGRRSMGNRFYPRVAKDRGFEVRSHDDLKKGLKDRFVVLEASERTERINAQIAAAGGNNSGESAQIMAEWVNLVEYPTVVVGSIPKEFADLPDEVLETVLAHHQKAVTLPRGSDGSPRFAAISGCDEAGATNAAQGQERVVVARLKDARFFYNEDRKRTLESRVDDLEAVTFQKGLGSYKDKASRISRLAESIATEVGAPIEVVAASGKAARLAKSDLTTLMVREFPELQGVMGGLYAAGSEVQSVADAIRWHYHPIMIEEGTAPAGQGQLPPASRPVFALVSLADKLDTLVGYFALGQLPSGSSDPYGLRRAGQGVIRLALDFWPTEGPAHLAGAIELACAQFFSPFPGVAPDGGTPLRSYEQGQMVRSQLRAFLLERLKGVLYYRGNGTVEQIEAVCGARTDRLTDVRLASRHLDDLATVQEDQPEVFVALAEAFKRAKNIVRDTDARPVLEEVLVEDAERRLFGAIVKAEATPASEPASRLRAVAGLRGDVDAFFTGVMVMSGDPRLKANRLALLSRLLNLVYEVADLSKLASPAGASAPSF